MDNRSVDSDLIIVDARIPSLRKQRARCGLYRGNRDTERSIHRFKVIMEGLVKNIMKNVMVELRFFHRREDKIDER